MAKRDADSSLARNAPPASATATQSNGPSPLPDAKDPLIVLDREPGKFALARYKNVFIQAWAGQADGAEIRRLSGVLGASGPRLGLRSTICVIAEGLPPPTDEARAGFVDLMGDKAKEIVCLAIVVHGVGFASSALRSALTGMRVAAGKSSYEMAVFTSIDEVGPWVPPRHEARTGVRLEPARLCDIVRRVQSAAAMGGQVPASAAPAARE